MKELFLTTITKPPEVIVNKFFCLYVCLFSCSRDQVVRAYLDTIQMTLNGNKTKNTTRYTERVQ